MHYAGWASTVSQSAYLQGPKGWAPQAPSQTETGPGQAEDQGADKPSRWASVETLLTIAPAMRSGASPEAREGGRTGGCGASGEVARGHAGKIRKPRRACAPPDLKHFADRRPSTYRLAK